MPNQSPQPRPSRRGPTEVKRRAILDAALMVFSSNGFARASMESVAEVAGVSNRTIYNHFRDKAELFQVVIESSAAQVAAAQQGIIEKRLRAMPPAADLELVLVDFAVEWTTPMPGYDAHRALVEQVRAEVGHIPQAAIDAWQQSGPHRVRVALAEAFAGLTDADLLQDIDPMIAAEHFTRLISLTDPLRPTARTSGKQARDRIADAVHAFLFGHASERRDGGGDA